MNKKTKKFTDGLVLVLLAAALMFLVNPFDWWMPSQMEMLLVAVFASVFVFFSAIFWREKAVDERDEVHLFFAGRVAFFVGTAITTLGIIIQSLDHNLDPWLPSILIGMVFAKYAGRFYAELRK